MTRKKTKAVSAASSREEAIALLEEFKSRTAVAARLEAGRRDAHAKIDADIDAQLGPERDRLKEITDRLQPWWAVQGKAEAGGKRSVVLAGCQIGNRKTPARVVHRGLKVADAVEKLKAAGLRTFLTVKTSLDKSALLKGLQASDPEETARGEQLRVLGFDLQADDEFFIDPDPARAGPAPEKKEAA
ncbi:hypothetical protein B5C34_05305 [Pacificimonas flava]|uniref:Host-nuclease inhibitor protein Gam n=2 Tax=Pacificimonas TaxID=1960290 RepID=A0A219B563_9SPHN|nr:MULTISPECIES: host-nuclease inhibitor Gam family protein [Pacificimonas]MBZ6377363.1 host-nuclease inhibitor Gam family protein [Pacificimonas aurantium]OWV32929.1 hypothetical protein B5C34_05305 [Pacificimonas flava]